MGWRIQKSKVDRNTTIPNILNHKVFLTQQATINLPVDVSCYFSTRRTPKWQQITNFNWTFSKLTDIFLAAHPTEFRQIEVSF